MAPKVHPNDEPPGTGTSTPPSDSTSIPSSTDVVDPAAGQEAVSTASAS